MHLLGYLYDIRKLKQVRWPQQQVATGKVGERSAWVFAESGCEEVTVHPLNTDAKSIPFYTAQHALQGTVAFWRDYQR